MVGVTLHAKWSNTRRSNGETLQEKIKDTVRLWKSGKFMHLCLRAWSMNMYCFSKIWFRTHSIDLREMDFNSISTSAKSWIYADMFFKPDEFVLHRYASDGGLGLHHVKTKALAGLIRSFLETACMPQFRQSLYHQLLFRYYVLEDRLIHDPGLPPFYSREFFDTIKQVYTSDGLKVTKMSEKDWYCYLLEKYVTKDTESPNLRPCRIERKFPRFEWDRT